MMSADIGVPWRSSAVGSGESSRSPSLSSLPPLPDLIPIRKGNNTLIKANLKHANQNNRTACNAEMSSNQHTAMESREQDVKPTATQLSFHKLLDGNSTGKDNDQHSEAVSIKRELHSDDGDAANGADAMGSACVSASYFSNDDTVQCDSNVDGGQLKPIDETSLNAECRNGLMHATSQSNSSTEFASSHDESANQKSFSSASKAGTKKTQSSASDVTKRTTRSALETYECKARLYTPLPAHYYSVQYARAPRRPKRKGLKGKGGVTKPGRKPKNKSNTKNASLALENVTNSTAAPSKINPIFLFVKRDNTRIVEVRCEDYDKRNRIRLTKTASGWRATPRTADSIASDANMLPKVMVKRLDDSDVKTTNQNSAADQESDKSASWRINPYSQNRIFIKKDAMLNNNDTEFNNMYESANGSQSNAEESSIDTSASDRALLVNESAARKKHKKKKKKKKEKHKSKASKLSSFVSHSENSKPAAREDDGVAHATPIPKSVASGNAPTNECKFTIRLSKNGESSFVATKTFSTISSIPPSQSPKPEFGAEKSAGLKLKIVAERQQFLEQRTQFGEERESSAEVHSAPMDKSNEVECDSIEMYGECDAPTETNLDALGASVNELAATIDCEKIDTKKEIVTPAVSPYHQVAYPSLPPLQPHQPIPVPDIGAVEISNTFIQPARVSQPSNTSETISSCLNSAPFASPDIEPVETFDSKLSVKQCVASLNSAAAPAQFQCSDNNNRIASESLADQKRLADCVDLLDESSYDIENIQVSESHGVDESQSNQLHRELGEYHDLIACDEDLLNGDNTMSGTELIDSLVERGCKENNISGEDDDNQHEGDLKNSICLSDDYNDVDTNLLLGSQPVVDILSRLSSETMASATKCLSFNEVGEIEGLSDSLFSSSKGDGLVPFSQSAFEELSMTLKGLEKQTNQSASAKSVVCTTVVSPDSCEDELPKDLSFKKTKELASGLRVTSPRTISRGSDAIQSPQPSGLPAVPPSPDIMIALNQHKKHHSLFLDVSSPKLGESNAKSDFFDLSSPLQKEDNESNRTATNDNARSILKRTLQREPLDLGSKHRKSASPTISCSQEVQRLIEDGESLARRIKTEHRSDNLLAATAKDTNQSAKDPDPLTQLRLLINNPEWKLPDPILVPKNRLNAVLASPAREIPLLLTTRPELRLPEAFAYPSILQDPDILVISFAQLETIIRKQNEFMKDADSSKSAPNKHHNTSSQSKETAQREHHHATQPHKERKQTEKTPASHAQKNRVKTPISNARQEATVTSPSGSANNNLANDINSATLEALNSMFWLPYLSQISQMGQITPEILKAMQSNLAMQQNAFSAANQFGLPNQMPNLNNPLELAMWQEAAANKVAIQRLMEMNAQNVREAQRKALTDKMQQRTQDNLSAVLRQQNLMQQQKSTNAFFQNFQSRAQQTQQKGNPPFLPPPFGKDDAQQRTSCSLQSPPLSKRLPNQLNANTFFPAANNFSNINNLHKFGLAAGNATDLNNPPTTNAMRKSRKEQLMQQQQQQQHLQSLLLQNAQHSQLNLPVHHQTNDTQNKSLMNLLQQSNLDQIRSPRNDNSKIPSFDLTLPNSSQNSTATRPKLRVKNGLHLLDPLANQRRFLSGNTARCNDSPEIGSTTNGIDEMMMNSAMLNSQASNYASPWHWTKVTATGE